MTKSEERLNRMSYHLELFAKEWLRSRSRPRPSRDTLREWSQLLESWIRSYTMPLFIRKARAGRGKRIQHNSGRILIPTDNSTAHWAYALALCNECPSRRVVKRRIKNNAIPLAMAPRKEERNHFKKNPGALRSKEYNLNRDGWKLAHIDPIGLRTNKPISEIDIEVLEDHFYKFLDPSNMFVVPKKWSGVSETEEMISVFRANSRRRLKCP